MSRSVIIDAVRAPIGRGKPGGALAGVHPVDLDRVNVNGGAIALGHPLGASGARLTATLRNAMEQRDAHIGLQVMCEAGGLADATIVERLR
ncbi:MAG: putative thiolase [Ilumatobacteraceae bacterium]|nr:putative thiolase [Ilumatobacteraceae bacterium]